MSFINESPTDFTIEENRTKMTSALQAVDEAIKQGEISAAPVVMGTLLTPQKWAERVDPSDSTVIVGKVGYCSEKQAVEALASLYEFFPTWRATPFEQRAQIVRTAGDSMAKLRFELSALIVRETGKPWKEADADVAEAIDFCRYYSNEMERIGHPRKLGDALGESNWYFYQPRGIVSVISPWNFPIAIACGMTVAALVTGNVVAFKPAEQSSLIASKLVEILHQSGIPQEALAFLPGEGEVIGATLVRDSRVSMICFTGSKEVGLQIIQEKAKVHPGQKHLKKVIAELGGKNAIIVDEDADVDEAIKGVLYSAFGYAGQKCSACSRAIIVGTAYEVFVNRIKEAASDLIIGNALDPSVFLGPVIDLESQSRIFKIIAQAERECKLLFKGDAPSVGSYVPVTIFYDVSQDSFIWNEEIFGPVLACAKADTFKNAVEMANNSQYALTGAVFSRSPANIKFATENFRVGNLYINRGSTGALVYRQPFGGFALSGIGTKAGGPDYLLQFVEPRTVTENTMRRGFSPDLL
ncbi:MAG: aldehyde dehydrogenase family protein [Bdellovibrionales bacterium]|nr:aldehyde dehydrogenase family protein [Bdellovibrionales bacterium]